MVPTIDLNVNWFYSFQDHPNNPTKVNKYNMSGSDEKIRLHITSPTLDESDDFSSLTRNFSRENGSSQVKQSLHSSTGKRNQFCPDRIQREYSPTDRCHT